MSGYRVIWYRMPDNLIGGPYAVAVMRPDGSHTGTRCTGCQTPERARLMAEHYAETFGTTDIREMKI